MSAPADHASARTQMVHEQLERRGIRDARVLAAMGAVPREVFVGAELQHAAYADTPLPIGKQQTISQPYVVALMLELAAIEPSDRVLEVGAGRGYVAALLGRLAAEVVAVERHTELADAARAHLAALDLTTIDVRQGDGCIAASDRAPFDAIIVSAGAKALPPALGPQLATGGRLVIPVGALGQQVLERHVRTGNGFVVTHHGLVAFVPLITAG